MKKNFFLTLVLALVALFSIETATAQAPVATPEEAITGLLNRIGGNGAADRFEIVIDANLAQNGKDVFVIAPGNGKPCIKGNTQLSVATGINWYLNHYAHINLTWNNLTTDLVTVELPVPESEEKHVCNTTYRYDFNTCTFSYSMAFWTWERWQREIDWMALHGINAPLNLVGLEVVTRNFLKELGMSDSDIAAYIAGPGFMAWFAMNNLEGWGGTINSPTTGVDMSGNPEWWYTRQEQLCKNMLQRMRELGMQPVIPGFSGQVPKALSNYTITGFSSGDVVNVGSWASNFPHPGVVNPSTTSYETLATIYYKHLHDVMGVSEFYSIDPFHEMAAPVAANVLYPNIMSHLDRCYALEGEEEIAKFNAPSQPKWIIQQWQGTPVSGAFSAMSSYGDRFIGLDLFADAPGKAKWNGNYYQGRPYIFCMLHNFGGRSGLHGRLESVMNDYFSALAKGNNCQGIGATPEGSETNPILYDMLFELPWMDTNASNRPTIDVWLEDYAYSRYGVSAEDAPNALAALQNLKKSVWACPTDQQGTSEAVILARPNWTVNNVSSWSTSAIYWDTQDVRLAADQLISIADLIEENESASGTANFNYDAIDVIRQAMVDYAAELLPLINAARNASNTAEYERLYNLYLQLMLDLDTMLSYDENFKLERWTSLARNIADEVTGTTENDRNWLEWNARTQVTVWANQDCALHDYSNRCWAGLIKDFHYWRWKYFFEHNGAAPSGGWYSGFEYPWTVDFNDVYSFAGDYSQIVIPTDMSATAKAVETFGNYFGRVKGATKNYIFPMGVETNATKSDVIPEIYRGQTVELPLIIGKDVTVSSVQIDLNGDGAMGNTETLTADGMNVTIPADATIGKTKAIVTFSDGTVITFNLALIEDITENRTVTAATADANMGTVAIEGTSELTITNMEAVKITATANTGYNFKNWTDAGDNVVSNDNPYIYYGKDAASFTANFIQDKWGVPASTASGLSDAVSNNQYVNNISFAYYMRDAETIYDGSTPPTSLFTTVPQIINVPRGASFTISWSDNGSQNLKKCFMSAYMDFNANGDFSEEGELVKVVGTKGADNSAVRSGSFQVLLPYDAPLGITHLRMRFDSAWGSEYNSETGAFNPKGELDRMCYEVILNITDKSDKVAHVTVKTNSDEWGSVKVWTNETPADITATQWDVTKGVPFSIAATPATEDTEFLGWYDHYGRLLTTELEYTMYAREDATYTAKFRRFIEIDGWQIEYRTEPGTDLKVKGELANGVIPENGKMYYIYAYPQQGAGTGTYVARYLYDNDGTLATNTVADFGNYVWTCIVNDDGTYSFKNASGKYLANNNSTDCYLSIGTTAAAYELEDPSYAGVAIKNPSSPGGKYMVTDAAGTSFNRYGAKANDGSWSSDYVFVELAYRDNVILTKVRKSGNHDLLIPETVNILGEDLKIVGFDNGLFANNKDLWTISLPATIKTVSSNRVFSTSVKGDGDYPQVIELGGLTLKTNEAWEIIATYKSDGVATFNEWGTPLLYAGSEGTGSELFWLSNVNTWSTCWHVRSPFSGLGNDYFKTHTDSKISTFVAAIENKGTGKAVVKVTNSNGEIKESTEFDYSLGELSAFSAKLPIGLDMTNFKVFKGNLPDPFEGCTNLVDITVTDGCDYYVTDRKFYSPDGTMLHTLADKEKEDEIRALGELIDLADALIEEVTVSVNPTGKATALPLTTTANSDYYVSTNADQNTGGGDSDGGGIAALVDNNENTYFHTRWGGTVVNEPHYIQVHLGANNIMNNFKFAYKPRNGSPAPTAIKVYGSNDGVTFTDVLATIDSNLPAHNLGVTYMSDPIDSKRYEYLRFVVTASAGPGNTTYGGQYFFCMLEFDLYKVTSTAEVAPKYKNLAGVTNEETATVYDSMAEALYFYNNGGTADELQAAYDALKPLYDALNAKKDKILNGVYNINFGGEPLFIAYAAANELKSLTGVGNAGYRLFDGTTTNTGDNNLAVHQAAIDTKATADALFTIVPKDDYSGYHLSAQGNYMQATGVHSQWDIQAFDTDVANAGVYLFEETATADVFKLKSTKANTNYVNDWGPVFGNDLSSKPNLSTFTLTPVAEYTLAVPASGATTLCLPFNVVLPAGVTAYDITEAQIIQKGSRYIYELNNVVAAEGDTLAKNTPVIIEAAEGNHTFTITMSDENVKGSASGSVLRSGLVKTTIDNTAVNYTFSNGTFSLVEPAADVPANQCWMVLAENRGTQILDESSYSGAFFYTTDEENPVLYRIIVNRTYYSPTILQYNESQNIVNIAAEAANASYQAWYFMESANGFVIKPYNAMDNVLSASSNSNAEGAVTAQPAGKQTYYEWGIETLDNGWYAIRLADDSNYLSNNGGNISNSMGFYNDKNDGGSQFKFVPITFENNNPRYYQLKDVTAAMDITKQAMSGDAPGCREGGDAHFDAYTAAAGYINEGNTADADDCYDAYTALRATRAALGEMKMPEPGEVYRIKNFIALGITGQKYHYIANNNAAISFPTEADNSTTLWVCVAGGEDGKYKFVSAMGTATLGWQKAAGKDDIQEFAIKTGVERGAVALNNSDVNLSLRNEAHDKGLGFDQASNNVTAQVVDWSTDWLLEPVADANVYYRRTLGNGYQWGTLYLPFAVEVPAGVTAYYATQHNVGNTVISLTEVGDTIPAYTPVLIGRSEEDSKSRTDYDFTLTADVKAIDGNIFEGSILTSYVECQKNHRYYLLLNASKGEAFYWIAAEYNGNGASGDSHIKCDANKAYLSVNTSAVSPSSYYRFEFEDGSTTGVEELECENGEAKTIYDLQGRRLTEITEPGVYIIDGKRVMIK